MTEMVQFSFALSPRMRSFVELRDGLISLENASVKQNGQDWLHAACDLRASLLGDQGRKSAIPEIISLFSEMQGYLKKLSNDMPKYSAPIQQACERIDMHLEQLQPGVPDACHYLAEDALISAYLNTQKKHDWLGHKLCMQQSISAIWNHSDARTLPLHQALVPVSDAVNTLNEMLNDFVGWDKRIAKDGSGQITPDRSKTFGLLVVALRSDAVADGIIPDISGNRLAIRLRFQRWSPGLAPEEHHEDVPYAMMLVPFGY